MRLGQIQNRKLISEGWNDPQFMLMEQKVIHPWVAQVEQYVFEAELTQDQIKNLFTNIEKGADEAGGNRTAIGKAKDIAGLPVEAVKWIDNKINELGKAVQQAGPVQNADQKFEELKQKIGSKDNKVVNAVKAVSDWAKANPKKASIAVAILTAAASIAAGPLGGAVAGFLARATKDLLQGEKLSTAIGKSIKTAAYGAMAGWLFNQLGDWIEGLRIDAVPYEKEGLVAIKFDVPQYNWSGTNIMGLPSSGSFGGNGTLWLNTSDMGGDWSWGAYSKDIIAQAEAGDLSAWNDLMDLRQFMTPANAIKSMNISNELAKEIAVNNDAALKVLQGVNDGISALAQGSVQATKDGGAAVSPENTEADGKSGEEFADKNESVILKGQKLSEGQVYLLFKRLENVNNHMLENHLMFESVFDAVSYYNRQTINEADAEATADNASAEKEPGMLSKIGGGIKKGYGALKQAGRNLTAKVTADKLMKAWNKAGSPTDSGEVYKIIQGAGVADDVIKGTFDSMKIEVPAATDAPDADKDAGAADAETNADAPTDSTAGDAGSDTTDTGAADTTAGGDEPAATDDAGATDTTTGDTAASSDVSGTDATTSSDTADTDDALGRAKQDAAMKKGRGLSPEEEAEVEKDFAKQQKATANKKPAVEPGTKVIVKTAKGKEIPATTTAGDIGSYDATKYVEVDPDGQGGNFPAQVANMTTPDGKPVATTTQQPATGSEEPAQTGATDANTASTGGDQGTDATTTPQTGQDAAQDATSGETPPTDTASGTDTTDTTATDTSPAPDNRGAGQGPDSAASPQAAAPIDINALAAELKKLSPEQIADAKKLLAA